MRKCAMLMLVTCLVASSLIAHAVAPVFAQAGYKPSVPQFTVKLIDNSYDVSPSTTTVTDPFTGQETTTTNPGHHVVDRTIEVTIKNLPFTTYKDADGYEHKLSYDVQFKGHFEDEQCWRPLSSSGQSDSQYTTITLSRYQIWFIDNNYQIRLNSLPAGSQLDFRVKAEVGYSKSAWDPDHLMSYAWTEYVLDAESGWSGVQTITISGETASSFPPSQTAIFPSVTSDGSSQPQFPDQTQPQNSIFFNLFFLFGVGALFAGVVIVVVMVIVRKHLKTSTLGVKGLYA
ncbi:MAG: hypothetical protein FWE56_04445 [Candidatus Bathyarchaeota archaeon]|nr:hypothetical protein [Candidatus Termiticorpusculum sp.]